MNSPLPPSNGWTPLAPERVSLRKHWKLPTLALLIGVLLVLPKISSSEGPADTESHANIEQLRLAWNGMSLSSQHSLCADVRLRGAGVVADDLQVALDRLDETMHDDISWFLTELACK